MARAVDGQLQSAIDTLQRAIDADPEIQGVLTREKARLASTRNQGGSSRDYQKDVRDRVTSIAKRKGLIPDGGSYFINANDGQLEPHGGWAGLSNTTRGLIIAAAATAATLGVAGPGAFGISGGGGGFSGNLAAAGSVGSAPGYVPAGIAGGGTLTSGLATGTLARYGLQYGLPIAGALIGGRMQANADRDAINAQMEYMNRALEQAREEQQYQRTFNEEARGYDRARYADSENASRRNYGNYVQTLEPFRAAGTQANQYAARLLGHSVPDYSGGSYYDLAREASRPVDLAGNSASPSSATPAPTSAPVAQTRPEPMPASGGGSVRMRAPTGQIKVVDGSQVAYYQSLGAEVV